MLQWLRLLAQRKQIREDRKYLGERVRRFLKNYLSADPRKKHEYYEIVAGASAACQPNMADPMIKNTELAEAAAVVACNVVRSRERQDAGADCLQAMITDAFATVAVAHRRAAASYTNDLELQRLGTAAVHLVTMANSHVALNNPDELGQP